MRKVANILGIFTKFFKETRVELVTILVFLIAKISLFIFFLKESTFRNPDSEGYLMLANNFREAYLENRSEFQYLALLRTPGYPFFISLLNSNTNLIILVQLILNALMSLIIVVFIKKVLNIENFKISLVVVVLVQLETSLTVYSYRILTEAVFTFLVLIFLFLLTYCIKLDKFNVKFLVALSLLVFLILMVRPIGLALLLILSLSLFYTNKKRILATLVVLIICFNISYSTFNYLTKQTFTPSTVQNHYLFIYQGVASKAISESQSLESVAGREVALRDETLGEEQSFAKIDAYNQRRGLDLIAQNKLSFLKLNLKGVIKLHYSPNRLELGEISSDEGRVNYSSTVENGFVILSLVITFIITTFGVIGALFYFRKGFEYKLLTTTVAVFVLFASGANAYGRFRVPIAPILSIFSALILVEFYKCLKYKHRITK